ncbi:MAG: holo-ACP synthase [Clostridia bacterium]
MRILTGTDIIEIERIRDSVERIGPPFLKKIYTEDEISYCESRGNKKYESYAARFAAKEAVAKAFGTGISPEARLLEIEIRNDERGKPCILLHGNTHDYYMEVLKGISADISLSHSDSAAVAFAVILAE